MTPPKLWTLHFPHRLCWSCLIGAAALFFLGCFEDALSPVLLLRNCQVRQDSEARGRGDPDEPRLLQAMRS